MITYADPNGYLSSSRFVVCSVTLEGERISAVLTRCISKMEMGASYAAGKAGLLST